MLSFILAVLELSIVQPFGLKHSNGRTAQRISEWLGKVTLEVR